MNDCEKDIRYMLEALREAEAAAAEDEIPVGAVVVSPTGRIIGRGHNRTEALADVTAHAEMMALTAASEAMGAKYLTGCTLYVTVEPCVMCAGAIGWSRPARVVCGCPDTKRGYTAIAPGALHPKTEVSVGVLESECGAMMKRFFSKKR